MWLRFTAVALAALLCIALAGDSSSEYQQLKSRQFHEEKGKEAGVTTLPSGVQFKVLSSGSGKQKPTRSDIVDVHYEGRLIDNTKFDSSYDRNEPANFGVTEVIAGWTELLQRMAIGDKWEVYIPWQKAYGARGMPSVIPPYASLVFTIELLGINGNSEL